MKSKRLLFTLVFLLSFVLVLAISTCAATITVHSGADATTASTTYNGSLTLPGNTEENETVTVYFTDDGRAWKAGETVSFTQNTVLYTIECTKITTVSEYNNATGGNNYILMNDINLTQSGRGPINGDNCTTRIFMNGKHVTIGNADGNMVQGNSHSFSLIGNGSVSSEWGGPVYRGHCNNSKTDVTWLIGKDVTIETNKDSNAIFVVWNTISSKSLSIHIYGTIVKAQKGTPGVWHLLSADSISTDYNIYLHEGSSIEFLGRLVRYSNSTAPADTKIGEIICNGGSVTLGGADYFFYDKSSSAYNGTITVNSGTFDIANADTLAAFKNAIVETKKAKDISQTSFSVICKECAFEKTLGDDFVDLQTEFTINNYCPNCKTTGESTKVSKIFTAKGYSVNPKGTVINAGFEVNLESLELYEEVVGKTTYGIVIANADTFNGKTFFNSQNKVNTDKSIQIDIERLYNHFSCSLNFGTSSNSTLNLVIAAYSINKSGVDFIQHSRGNAVDSSKIADGTFKSINLNMLVAEQPSATKEELL